MNGYRLRRFPVALCAVALVAFAGAAPLEIRKNDVVPVRFDTQLSTADSRAGDPFTATAKDDSFFPRGTVFDGHVVRVELKSKRHGASMDLAFDDVRLPDGSKHDIRGVPIPLSSKYVDREEDGHYVAKPAVRKDTAVGVGALAGFIVGALLNKPFEGTFVGTLAGILVASSAGDDSSLVISRGAEAGVLFQRGERFETASASTPPSDHERDREASPAPGSSLKIGGRSLTYTPDLAPFRSGDVLMVPIQSTAKQLGLSYDEAGGSIFVENDDHSLRFEPNSSSYRVDGRSANLAASVIQRNGAWYAPAAAFEAVVGK